MSDKSITDLEHIFRHQFKGLIWNMLAHPDLPLLMVEVRDEITKKVTFSALDLVNRQFLWSDHLFEEPWWIGLTAIASDNVYFTIYVDTQNPDKKSLLVFDWKKQAIAWWKNQFSLSGVNRDFVWGIDTLMGTKFVGLRAMDGAPAESDDYIPVENFFLKKPLQYFEQSSHFDTVSRYLRTHLQVEVLSVIEYLEIGNWVIMAYYVNENGLANYLIVLNKQGEVIFKEKIAEQVKGIAVDAFFVLAEFLIFVKNKRELVSIKLI